MEQAKYWMWAKPKGDMDSHVLTSTAPSYGDSWEEQAFAEDAAGPLGGCIWPPRSYSCSFCRREFRSAQALGGHMNVHRRDRARLKQSPIPQSEVLPQNDAVNHSTSFDVQYPSQIYAFLYNPNSDPGVLTPPTSHSRVSAQPVKVNSNEKFSALSFFSPIVEENQKKPSSSSPLSWSSFIAGKGTRVLESKNEEKKSKILESFDVQDKEDDAAAASSMNLNFVDTRINVASDEEVPSCKRRRIDTTPLTFIQKLSELDRCHPPSEVLKLHSNVLEELDLELRLGDAPKVK